MRARLEAAGFDEPDRTLDAMRALGATCAQGRSSTRNLLANLLATIVAKEVPLSAPGTVLTRLERVVAGTGAAASFYRALLEDPALRHRLLAGLDAGDLYAARLAAYPEVLDFLAGGALDRDAFHAAVVQAFDEAVAAGPDIEPTLDPFRRVKAIQEFKVLAEWLTVRRLELLNEKLSLVADCAVRAAARAVARRFPPAPDAADADAGWAVFALGKLGGRELTVYSDLDLVFLYAGDAGDARRFERHQKFVRAVYDLLSKTTAAGFAYKLDTRLRPEGRMGALATPLGAFERYLAERAEIWERMAWTRCRFVGGDAALAGKVQEAVGRFVYGPWSPEIPGYARHVRGRMERELTDEAAGGQLDLKRGRGGLADIDFLLQVLQLREGPAREGFRVPGTRRLLSALPATRVLPAGEATALREAYAFLRELETVLRIHTDSDASAIPTDPAALEPLARQLGTPMSGGELLARYRDATAEVRAIYEAGLDRLACTTRPQSASGARWSRPWGRPCGPHHATCPTMLSRSPRGRERCAGLSLTRNQRPSAWCRRLTASPLSVSTANSSFSSGRVRCWSTATRSPSRTVGSIASPAARKHVRCSGCAQDATASLATAIDISDDCSNTTSPLPDGRWKWGANGMMATVFSRLGAGASRSPETRPGIRSAATAARSTRSRTTPIPWRNCAAIASLSINPTASAT